MRSRGNGIGDDSFFTIIGIIIIAFVTGLIIFAVVACINTPNTGTVYDKKYSPAYTTISYDCASYTKSGACNLRLPHTNYYAEQWYLCLRNGDKSGCKPVDQVDYHKYEIGQTYP